MMKVQLCRASLPVLDIALVSYLKQFGVVMGDRISLERDKESGK